MPLSFSSLLTEVRGIGPARFRELAQAGVETVSDLLHVLPRRFEDRRRISDVEEITTAAIPGRYTLRGRLEAVSRVRVRRRGLSLVRARFVDETGDLPALWFNQPYLAQQVDAEAEYLLHGEVRPSKGGWELINPSVERVPEAGGEAKLAGRIVPVYPSLGAFGPARVGRLVRQVLEDIDEIDWEAEAEERLPEAILERHGLPRVGPALRSLHSPDTNADDVESLNRRDSPAHARLIYGEFLRLQLELAAVRSERVRDQKAHSYGFGAKGRARVMSLPPFDLTGAQRRAFGEIEADLSSPFPMTRLLQGDVGSGKTIVAALAMALAAESGLQAALMAPTEILAEQHYRSFRRLLGERYRVVLLTGSAADQREARADLAAGRVPIAIGTHALIQDTVAFRRLGLAVVDEQHRFGVAQRQALSSKGDRPDLLVMTATPIPRSLTLTVYGDLDVSVIDELPPGRKAVRTRVVPAERRQEVYGWLAERIAGGGQAYVVCPFIEASESVDAASIEDREAEVRERFGAFRPAVLHGRISAEERAGIVRDFAAGEIGVLLATTIIEVGVDVPQASVMVIESAERFGLAQLHQLRGRVGRGERESVCVALHGRLTEDAERRLAVFGESRDGFHIAEADLEIRGPGDVLGTRQAGVPLFRVANVIADRAWLETARRDARELVDEPSRFGAEDLVAEARRRARCLSARLEGA